MLTMRMPRRSIKPRLPMMLWGTLGALLLALCLVAPAMAQTFANPPLALDGMHTGSQPVRLQGPGQNFNGDMTVERGQTLEEDVFLYSGNVEIEEGGRIVGDLMVFSGNIEIGEGAEVDGDVVSYSGNVDVAGRISGDLIVWSGDVDLASSANVEGDVSVASGSIDRSEGATVGGSVARAPSFRFPGAAPDAPDAPRGPGVRVEYRGESFFEKVLGFIGRLFVAALMTAFTMLLVGGLFYLRPQWVADTRRQLREHLALSAVLGAVANLTVIFLTSLLAITVCLLPLALIPIVLLLAVNVLGWAVASQIVGERIVKIAKQEVQPALTILVGALFLTGVCAVLWAFGGCFRFIATLLIFGVSSLGAGAVLVPWVNRRRGGNLGSGGTDGGPNGGNVPPSSPAPAGGSVTPVGARGGYDVPAESFVASSGETSPTVARPSVVSASTSDVAVDDQDIAEPLDYLTAAEVNEAQERSQADAPTSRSRSAKASEAATPRTVKTGDTPVELDATGPVDYMTAQEVNTAETISEGDDFLQIKGIGPTYARRLKDAGYASFAQIAAASPEEVAAAIGWPVDRVRRSEVIDQAKVLAAR